MNVAELKELLDGFSDDTIVRFSYDNGDYWHHIMAVEITCGDLLPVKHNDYVNNFIVDDNDDGEFIEDDKYCLVLS